jgi:hypothetical protein
VVAKAWLDLGNKEELYECRKFVSRNLFANSEPQDQLLGQRNPLESPDPGEPTLAEKIVIHITKATSFKKELFYPALIY